ncbi:MAG: hypothetical protein JWO38_7090 [Gemmataceae bacterium]|nr:hypothetical protein [Gemmataceae bacterium]
MRERGRGFTRSVPLGETEAKGHAVLSVAFITAPMHQ